MHVLQATPRTMLSQKQSMCDSNCMHMHCIQAAIHELQLNVWHGARTFKREHGPCLYLFMQRCATHTLVLYMCLRSGVGVCNLEERYTTSVCEAVPGRKRRHLRVSGFEGLLMRLLDLILQARKGDDGAGSPEPCLIERSE